MQPTEYTAAPPSSSPIRGVKSDVTENAPPQRCAIGMPRRAGNVEPMKLLQMFPCGLRGIVVHAAAERHETGPAAGQQPAVAGQSKKMHEAAAVLDAFTFLPADGGALIRAEGSVATM